MRVFSIVLFIATAGVLGCATDADVPAGRSAAWVERGVHEMLTEQQAAWNAGDIPGFMNGYWRSEKLVFTSGGRIRRGFDAALAGYEDGYDRETMGRLEFSDLEFTHISHLAVLLLGRWAIHDVKEPTGGVFTLLVRRIDGEWRVVHDHTSVLEKK